MPPSMHSQGGSTKQVILVLLFRYFLIFCIQLVSLTIWPLNLVLLLVLPVDKLHDMN